MFGRGLTAGVWAHLAAVNTGKSVTLYVDGSASGAGRLMFDTADGGDVLWMGDFEGAIGAERGTDGILDEVSLYDRALSAEEVAAIFAVGADGKCDP